MNENNLTKTDFKMLQDFYLRLEPYQYFQVYLEAHKRFSNSQNQDELDRFRYLFKNAKEFITQKAFIETGEIAFIIPEIRILNIDEDLLPIIQDTKPDYSDLKMKYPVMFINQQIKVENGIINGFLLVDYEQIERDHPELAWEKDETNTSIRILAIGIDLKHEFEFYSVHPVVDDKIDDKKIFIEDKEENKAMRKLSIKARELACNLLNLLVNDNKEIEYIDVKVSDEQNRKRHARGKLPMKDTTTLRVGGFLKRYATEYKANRGSVHVRYHVGGFWRHYNSERYKEMKGQKQWIYPHYRGMINLPFHVSTYVDVIKGDRNE